MHVCPEKVASRYAAGLACLIGCAYNGIERMNDNAGSKDNTQEQQGLPWEVDEAKIRSCERECNEQFMSVMPVEGSWIDTNTTLASFSK